MLRSVAAVGVTLCLTSLFACESFSGSPVADVTPGSADASTDASTDAIRGDADTSFCERVTSSALPFCEDFDRTTPPLPSGLSLRMDEFASPPNALRLEVGALDGGSLIAPLSHDFGAIPRRVRVSAELKVVKADAYVNVIALLFDLQAPARTAELVFQIERDGYRMVELIHHQALADEFKAHPLVARPWPAASFLRVEMTWHDNFTADLVVDDVPVRTAVPLLSSWGKGNLRLKYGIVFANGTGDFSGTLDNVVVDGDL